MDIKVYQPLGKYIEQIRGVSYKPNDIYDKKCDESIAILRANNIQNNHVDLSDLIYINKNKVSEIQKLKKGDILICASSGSKNLVGKATIINNDLNMSFGAFCKVLRTSKLNQRFLGHYFASPIYRKTISRLSVGANINNIRKEHIDNLMIPIYSSEKQTKISDILDKISILIDYSSEKLKKYDELVKSQFIEMFGNVFTQKAVHTLGDYISDKTDKVKKDYLHENIKYVDISSIDNTQNEITSYTTYKTQDRPSRAQQIVEDGDIVISTVRPNLNNVAMIKDDFENIVASTGFCVLKKNTQVNEYFIFTLVKDSRFADYLSKLTTGASYPAVSNKSVLNFKIDMPPIELQNKFAEIVKHIDKLKFTLKEEIKKLQECYNSLMKEYFE